MNAFPPSVRTLHWAERYIGIPYQLGARGPDRLDCWGLVSMVYLHQFGINLPIYPGISLEKPVECSDLIATDIKESWTAVDEPFDGAAVAMSHRRIIHHIGLYTTANGGRILHCFNGRSVSADTIRRIQLYGIQTILFYRHREWPTSLKLSTR